MKHYHHRDEGHMSSRLALFAISVLLLAGCGKPAPREYQGYIEAENVYLAAPYGGNLVALERVRGSRVQKGERIFELDSNPESIVVREREAALVEARRTLQDLQKPRRAPEVAAIEAQIHQVDADLALAKLRVKRQQELFAAKATDKDTLDAAVTRLDEQQHLRDRFVANLELAKLGSREDQIRAQEAAVLRAEENLAAAQWNLSQKTVTAPASGMIFDTYYRPGEYVAAQQPVASLLVPEYVYVEFFVPVSELAVLHPGSAITFDCDGCKPANEAIVSYVSPEAEFVPPLVYSRENYEKLVYRMRARPKNPENFRPGQPVSVHVS